MLSPLTDPVTALLNLSSGFHLRAGAEALPVGQAALHPLTSHSAGGNFLTYPSLSPNPSTLASWTLSEHTRHTSPLPLRLECSFPVASTWLASFWFLLKCHFAGVYGAGDRTQSVAHASCVPHL